MVEKCLEQHGESWLHPPIVQVAIDLLYLKFDVTWRGLKVFNGQCQDRIGTGPPLNTNDSVHSQPSFTKAEVHPPIVQVAYSKLPVYS